RRNRDQQSGHRRNQRRRHTRRHRGQSRAALLSDMTERAHHAPDGSEQTEKRSATDRNREQDQTGFQFQRFLRDAIFQAAFHVFHAFERNEAFAQTFGSFQSRIQFHTARLVHHEQRTTFRLH